MNTAEFSVLDMAPRRRTLKDVEWLAAYLNVSKSWVYQACASGVVPCVRIGALLRFDAAAIEAWVRGEKGVKVTKLPSCR
jgi:excisionase family DNA binding protein